MDFILKESLLILERTPHVVSLLLQDLPDKWTTANEGEGTWSAFDIIGHYIHGEKTDWIPRMEIILNANGDKRFEPFDRFAQFENSKGKSISALINEFAQLRKRNIQKLQDAKITEKSLDQTGIHPHFGQVTLRQLLASWVVHDLTHIHQLSRVLAKQYEPAVGPWKEYMGVLGAKK